MTSPFQNTILNVTSATPILRQILPTDVPDSACLKANAICSSKSLLRHLGTPLAPEKTPKSSR
jgi:hypothetical protein